MTRNEFNLRFGADLFNTAGYSEAELEKINADVFASLEPWDAHDDEAYLIVDALFERAFDRASE
jgi:hypothetical protein